MPSIHQIIREHAGDGRGSENALGVLHAKDGILRIGTLGHDRWGCLEELGDADLLHFEREQAEQLRDLLTNYLHWLDRLTDPTAEAEARALVEAEATLARASGEVSAAAVIWADNPNNAHRAALACEAFAYKRAWMKVQELAEAKRKGNSNEQAKVQP